MQKRKRPNYCDNSLVTAYDVPDQATTPAVEHAYGTAFFVTSDGYMLTNHHVIEGADKITVTLNDRTELDVTLVGSDERSRCGQYLRWQAVSSQRCPLGTQMR